MGPKYKLAQRKPEKEEFPGLPGDTAPPPATRGDEGRVVFEEDDEDDEEAPTPATAGGGGGSGSGGASSPGNVMDLFKKQGTTESIATNATTATVGSSQAGGAMNCDLCNGEVRGMSLEEHVVKCHPHLLMWCEQLIMDKVHLKSNSSVNPITSLSLGRKAKELAQGLDKGASWFDYAIAGTKQLTMIARQRFPKASAYMFGSCVALGVWDGDGDVDMTIVDPVGWASDPQAWPGDEGAIVMKLTKCLRDSGFAFEDLEPVRHTRVPIVKHSSTLKTEKWRLGDKRCNQVHIQLDSSKLSKTDKTNIANSIKGGGGGARMLEWESGSRIKVQCRDGTDAVAVRTEPIIGLPAGCRERYRVFPNAQFKPPIFYMDFDVSSRAHGVRNSFLLRGYFKQHHAFRAGSVFVKKWSKASGVNNSRKGYLTSYAVNLLWLHYLIQKQHANFFEPQTIPLLPDDPDKELTYMPIFPHDSMEEEKNLGELLVGFFKFYATEFDWEKDVVTLSQAEVKPKNGALQWTQENEVHAELFRNRVWYRLCIEDPYEPNLNLGRHVSPVKIKKLMSEFLYGYTQLCNGQVGGLLYDRSSDKVKERMEYLLKKAMVGYEERPYSEVVEEFIAADLPSWAAFQVEHKCTKVFDLAAFTYLGADQAGGKKNRNKRSATQEQNDDEEGGGEAGQEDEAEALVAHRRAEETFIDGKARPMIQEIEEELAKKPILGVRLTDKWHDMYIDTLFPCDQSSDRLFLENSHVDKFYQHKAVVDAIMRDELSYPLTTLGKEAKKRMPACDVEVINAVVDSFKSFAISDGVVRLATSSQNKVLGDCADCGKRKVQVWGERPGDKDMYCGSCWAAYKR